MFYGTFRNLFKKSFQKKPLPNGAVDPVPTQVETHTFMDGWEELWMTTGQSGASAGSGLRSILSGMNGFWLGRCSSGLGGSAAQRATLAGSRGRRPYLMLYHGEMVGGMPVPNRQLTTKFLKWATHTSFLNGQLLTTFSKRAT